MSLTQSDRVWLACAIDTDGHIGLKLQRVTRHKKGKKYSYTYVLPQLGFANTHEGVVKKFAGLIQAKYHKGKQSKPYDSHFIYRTITSKTINIEKILNQILPYIIVKNERALYTLNFCKYKLARPRDHSSKSNQNEPDLAWYTQYILKFSSHKVTGSDSK